jgi:hypothetical protein
MSWTLADLSEEHGGRFTQEALRDALLTPIRAVWADHANTWFCGTRIDAASLSLYQSSRQREARKRHERRVASALVAAAAAGHT